MGDLGDKALIAAVAALVGLIVPSIARWVKGIFWRRSDVKINIVVSNFSLPPSERPENVFTGLNSISLCSIYLEINIQNTSQETIKAARLVFDDAIPMIIFNTRTGTYMASNSGQHYLEVGDIVPNETMSFKVWRGFILGRDVKFAIRRAVRLLCDGKPKLKYEVRNPVDDTFFDILGRHTLIIIFLFAVVNFITSLAAPKLSLFLVNMLSR